MAKKIFTVIFFLAVTALLVVYAQKVDWPAVWKVIRHYDRTALLGAVGLTIASYLIYGCYDLLGRAWCGHKLAKRQVMLVSFICYAFNLTLSTWVGGIGMRYRLYSRLGLSGGTITRIFSLSITTNWLGFILLGGVIFTANLVALPAHWYISQDTLRLIGGGLLAMSALYLWACAFARRRHLTIKGQRLVLPSWRFALLQMALSVANWMVMGAIIWLLMAQQVDYFLVWACCWSAVLPASLCIFRPGSACWKPFLSPCFPPSRLAAGRLLPPCWPGARCITFCRCLSPPSAICCWRVGRKHYAKRISVSWRTDR
jgi:uncharacterized membrane protein YbhN (UPF0104 family)